MATAITGACTYGRCPNHAGPDGRCAQHPRDRERRNADVRRWYHTPRWRALRVEVLMRDPYCDDCAREDRRTPATDVDHTVPHRGDPRLFWDPRNLRGKCHAHHSQKTRRGE